VTLGADVSGRACPLFVGRLIRGVRNGPSPRWLQDRLRAIGLRPISALVDITNYITFDRARPLHVFDADRVRGGLTVRKARPGESLEALDGRTYVFQGGETLVCDEAGPEAIGGIIGGLATGCTEATVNVFLESAWWDPIDIAATGRRHRISTDARYRFERGADPAFTPAGAELATRMILDLCGGEPSALIVAGAVPDTSRRLRLRPARVGSLVGMAVPADEQARILEALGFGVSETAEGLAVSPPPWRPDVQGEADLVEEVARVASLAKLRGAPMPRAEAGVTRPVLTPMQRREALARRSLAALGLNECVTYSFIAESAARAFGGGGEAVRLENPISSEMTHLRPGLMPGLIAAAARNQARGFGDLALFEIGPVFHGGEPGEQATEAALLRTGTSAPRNPHGTRRPVDVLDAKADAEAVLSALGAPVERLAVVREGLPGWLHPGRSAFLSLGPKPLALIGELHPQALAAAELRGPAVAATLFLAAVPFPKARSTTRPALQASDFQAVERDFAFVVDARVEAEALLRAARSADRQLIERAAVFDVFAGAKAEEALGPGRKSLAISVRLQPRTGTLTEAEIEAVAARIVAAVAKATGAVLRG
jgi:phenylalanyl-tRNA synthetase beta chain